MTKQRISRRRFLGAGAATGVAFAAPTIVPAPALGKEPGKPAASERVTIAGVGCGGRGSYDLDRLVRYGGQVVAVCDVNKNHLARAMKRYKVSESAAGGDFRETVTRKDVDAVMVGTIDHWHVLIALAALKAGKDIYVEKPVGKNIGEGRALLNAVKKSGRIFTGGTESRAMASTRRICELVRNGRIGKVKKIITACPGGLTSGPPKPAPVPHFLDYDMYTGPAPKRPYDPKRIHTRYHYHISDYCSSGFMAAWGVHVHDIAHWAMGLDDTGPAEIEGEAAYPPKGDLCDNPLTWKVQYTYADGLKMEFVGGSNWPYGHGNGVRFEGTKGWITTHYGGAAKASDPKILGSKIGPNEIRLYNVGKGDDNFNFLQCVKSRKQTCSPANAAHSSAAIGYLGEIACRLGRKLKWDPAKEVFENDDEANKLVSPPMRPPWKLEA
ncbi:Gfo/Idh/MocA family oxidoreductase [bacterium]|nr:Gfo/Idh/MocA family oxidoreductase [bacterium]